MVLALSAAGPASADDPSRIETFTVFSPALASNTSVDVLLPSGYDEHSAERYPVLYLLHGGFEDYTYWQQAGIQQVVGDRQWIVVIPDGGSLGFYTDWYNGGSFGLPRWEDYHIGELIPAIDARYRTIADRTARAVAGDSMGGFGATSYAARHPDFFGAAASISGMVQIREPGETLITTGLAPNAFGDPASNTIYWAGHNPNDLAANLRDTQLELSVGNGEPGSQDVADNKPVVAVAAPEELDFKIGNDQFDATLTGLGIAHQYSVSGGVHQQSYFVEQLQGRVLPFLEHAFANPRPRPGSWSYMAIEPSFSVWGWSFQVRQRPAREFLRLSGVSDAGLTATGSGSVDVQTPTDFVPGAVYRVGDQTVAADPAGRLSFAIDLGPGHTADEYTPQEQAQAAADPGYWHTVRVGIEGKQ